MPTLFPPDYPDRPDAPLLSFGPSFSEEIARSLIAAVWQGNNEQPFEAQIRVAAALTMLEAFHPRDHLECMLAAQGVAAHAMIMECFRRAMHPDTAEAVAIKLRGNAVQLSRMFSALLRDMERRQAKPLTERPSPPASPPVSDVPPDSPDDPPPRVPVPADPPAAEPQWVSRPAPPREMLPAGTPQDGPPAATDSGKAGAKSRLKRTRADASPPNPSGAAVSMPNDALSRASEPGRPITVPVRDEGPELPEDIETRPDGTPGSLDAYAPKPPVEEYIPDTPAIMLALATRPSPWRMVNTPKDDARTEAGPIPPSTAVPEDAETRDTASPVAASPADGGSLNPPADSPPVEYEEPGARGPLDLTERIFTGDALARFASARFDPNAPDEPLSFEHEDSVVELELISAGGDPELEARRAAMMAAHPNGKPIVTFRHGTKAAPDETPDTTDDETPEGG